MNTQKSYVPHFCVLTNGLSLLSNIIYLPSLPLMAQDLQTSAETMQDTVALNLLGMGLSTLIYGSLADIYGRRIMMLFGFGILGVFSLACAFASSIGSLMVFRFLAGCGAGASMALGITMVNDIYKGLQAAKVISQITLATILAPACAPLLGGYLTVLLGWRSTFLVCSILAGSLWLLMWLKLQETLPLSAVRSSGLRSSIVNYGRALSHRSFMAFALSQGIVFCGLWAYQTVAPFIFITQLGVPLEHYGYYTASISLSHGAAALLVQRLVRRGHNFLMQCGVYGALGGSLGLFIVGLFFPSSTFAATAAASLYAAAIAFVLPSAIAQSMEIMPQQRGVASAVLVSVRLVCAFWGSKFGGIIGDNFIPVALFMGLCTFLLLASLRLVTASVASSRL